MGETWGIRGEGSVLLDVSLIMLNRAGLSSSRSLLKYEPRHKKTNVFAT